MTESMHQIKTIWNVVSLKNFIHHLASSVNSCALILILIKRVYRSLSKYIWELKEKGTDYEIK